jgi:predicted transcriptional regulator YheO
VDALAATFGPSCEVVLHNLANPAHSVVHIVNGHVSGRQVGDPATDLALRTLEQAGGAPYLANYASVTTDGRELKSTSVMIRDRTGHTVGMLCINLDTSVLTAALTLLEALTRVEHNEAHGPTETMERDINGLATRVLDEVLRGFGKPVRLMDRRDKQEAVAQLCARGLFSVKGVVPRLASRLQLAVPTIYKYADRARRAGRSPAGPPSRAR